MPGTVSDLVGRSVGEMLVGRRVSIRFTGDSGKPWFEGEVVEFHPATDEHLILYDDGEQRLHELEHEEALNQLRWLTNDAPDKQPNLTTKATTGTAERPQQSQKKKAAVPQRAQSLTSKKAPPSKSKASGVKKTQASVRPSRDQLTASVKQTSTIPPGWKAVRHDSSKKSYNTYQGPNGLHATSLVGAWKMYESTTSKIVKTISKKKPIAAAKTAGAAAAKKATAPKHVASKGAKTDAKPVVRSAAAVAKKTVAPKSDASKITKTISKKAPAGKPSQRKASERKPAATPARKTPSSSALPVNLDRKALEELADIVAKKLQSLIAKDKSVKEKSVAKPAVATSNVKPTVAKSTLTKLATESAVAKKSTKPSKPASKPGASKVSAYKVAASKAAPQAASKTTPKAAPKTTPKAARKAPAKAATEAAPKAARKDIAKAASKAAPKAALKAAAKSYATKCSALAVVGRRLSIRWTAEPNKPWFSGKIVQFLSATDEHLILYDDGDQRAHDLREEAAQKNLRWAK